MEEGNGCGILYLENPLIWMTKDHMMECLFSLTLEQEIDRPFTKSMILASILPSIKITQI